MPTKTPAEQLLALKELLKTTGPKSRKDYSDRMQQLPAMPPTYLRQQQQQDMRKIFKGMQTNATQHLLVTKPTGTGKTAEMAAVVKTISDLSIAIIVIVPTTMLVEQTKDKFTQYIPELAGKIAVFCPTLKRLELGPITITTQQSYLQQVKKAEKAIQYMTDSQQPSLTTILFSPATITALVVDEAHHLVGKKTLELLNRPSSITTPPTSPKNKKQKTDIAQSTGPQPIMSSALHFPVAKSDQGPHSLKLSPTQKSQGTKRKREDEQPASWSTTPIFEPVVYGFSASTMEGEYPELEPLVQRPVTQTLKQAMEAKEISGIELIKINFSMYSEAREASRRIRSLLAKNKKKADGTLDATQDTQKIVANLWQNKLGFTYTAISLLQQGKHPTGKTMIFCDSIAHANIVSQMVNAMFNLRGTKIVAAYHSQNPERTQILENFKAGSTPFFIAVNAADEGLDVDGVRNILDLSLHRTKKRRMIQRVGRGLRLGPNGENQPLRYFHTQVLTGNLQLDPRKELLSKRGNIGSCNIGEQMLLTAANLHLPANAEFTIKVPVSRSDQTEQKQIISNLTASPAKIMLGENNRANHKLGEPPEVEDTTPSATTNSRSSCSIGLPKIKANHSGQPTLSHEFMALQNDGEFLHHPMGSSDDSPFLNHPMGSSDDSPFLNYPMGSSDDSPFLNYPMGSSDDGSLLQPNLTEDEFRRLMKNW